MAKREGTGYSVGRGFAFAAPFLLFFVGVFFLGMYLFQSVVEETAYFEMIVGSSAQADALDDEEDETEAEPETATDLIVPAKPITLEKVPSIAYGKRFARLNVDGWNQRDIPVYLGADKKILKKGAGMSFGSYFPGEGGCTIISAHVTRQFRQLEDTKPGTRVTLETTYGPYTYVVKEVKTANGTDSWYKDAGYQAADYKVGLMLYTCYPYNNHGERRTQRCVLLCEMTDGAEVSK